ncbi:hypothetical protein AWC38_SpisGene19522 [Stylophora pistillata]|uniref:Uncharacterized protein n=2 Tax=Stylophora pistillata TaxID=50429 RepID=A0A2B4RGB7_STYPI|nr:hypothetical protein AWC38_SpisGene19522 [Stylophora pistillata]
MSTCEDKVGNCHKKPCYSDKSNKCCECNDTATKGSYCQSCYERKYPPTPLLEAQETAGGLSLKLNVGAASNQEFMKAAFQSFERALAGGAQQTKAITCGEKHSISDELEDEYYDKFTDSFQI